MQKKYAVALFAILSEAYLIRRQGLRGGATDDEVFAAVYPHNLHVRKQGEKLFGIGHHLDCERALCCAEHKISLNPTLLYHNLCDSVLTRFPY